MGIASGLKDNLKASVTGGTVQGVLTIYDRRLLPTGDIEEIKAQNVQKPSLGNSTFSITKGTAISKTTAGLSAKVTDSISHMDTLAFVTDAMGGNASQVVVERESTAIKRLFLQFNPNMISINAQGGGYAQITNYGNDKGEEAGLKYTIVEPRIEVTIPLVFDAVNNRDAFFEDKLNLNPTEIAKSAATFVQTAVMDQEFTVQTQVEGLMAAIRNDKTRQATFSWGDMSYSGLLNQVNANYTMFSPTGHPIRAVVSLVLLCLGDSAVGQGNMGKWMDKYDAAFGKEGVTSLGKKFDVAPSLFNMGN